MTRRSQLAGGMFRGTVGGVQMFGGGVGLARAKQDLRSKVT